MQKEKLQKKELQLFRGLGISDDMLASFVIAVILTNRQDNVLKGKILIPVIMFICFVFLPVGMSEHVRGLY